MSRLVVDSVSARSLPVLDKFYRDGSEKFDSIVESTSGEPLVRLFKASIARQTMLGYPLEQKHDAARLVEILIHNNLFSVNGDGNEEEFYNTIEILPDTVLRVLLKISVIRFVMLNSEV